MRQRRSFRPLDYIKYEEPNNLAFPDDCTCIGECKEILIGHAAPFTVGGVHKQYPEDVLSRLSNAETLGLKLALSEWNAKKIRIGDEEIQFVLREFDDQGNIEPTKLVAQKLIDLGVVGVIGHLNSGTSIAVAPLYAKAKVPHITLSATNPFLTQQGWRTTFRLVGNDDQIAFELANLFGSDKHTLLFVSDKSAYASAFEIGMSRWQNTNANAKSLIKVDEANFEKILMLNENIDFLFVVGGAAFSERIIRYAGRLRPNLKIIGGDFICHPSFFTKIKNLKIDNRIYCANQLPFQIIKNKEILDFLSKMKYFNGYEYEGDSNHDGLHHLDSMMRAYDAVNLMIESMVKADSTKPEIWIEVMRTMKDFEGKIQRVNFNPNGDLSAPIFTLFEFYSNGTFQPLQTFPGQ